MLEVVKLTKNTDIKVKDIIIFLQQFDPETPVYLDPRDGWKNLNKLKILWFHQMKNMLKNSINS